MPGGFHRACCCDSSIPCQFCSGPAPDFLKVTVSDCLWCGDVCWPGTNRSRKSTLLNGGPNGVFILTRFSLCEWRLNVGSYRFQHWFPNTNCTGGLVVDEVYDIVVRVVRRGAVLWFTLGSAFAGVINPDGQEHSFEPSPNACEPPEDGWGPFDLGPFLPPCDPPEFVNGALPVRGGSYTIERFP